MVANEILRADFLDLLFESRNKKYGAYALRRNYRKRMWLALAITLVFGGVLFWYLQLNGGEQDALARMNVREVVLQNVDELEPPPPPPPPETKAPEPPKAEAPAPSKPKVVQPKIETTKFTPPVIKKDNEVKKTEVPPVKNIATVAVVSTKGMKAADNALPPLPPVKSTAGVDGGKGVIKAPPKKKVDENKIFEKVEIEASVNTAAWRRHLQSRLQRYIEDAAYDGMEPGRYTVNVRFLVEKNGNISHVKALNNPGYGLARGAEQVVKNRPKMETR